MFQRLDQDSIPPKFRIRLAKQRQPVSCDWCPTPGSTPFDSCRRDDGPAWTRPPLGHRHLAARSGPAVDLSTSQRRLAGRVVTGADQGWRTPPPRIGAVAWRGRGAEPGKNRLQRPPRSANSSCSRVCVASRPQDRPEDRNPLFLAALSAKNCPRCGERGQVCYSKWNWGCDDGEPVDPSLHIALCVAFPRAKAGIC